MVTNEEFKDYFERNYPDLQVIYISDEKIVVLDENSNKFAVPLGKDIDYFVSSRRSYDVVDLEEIERINPKLQIFNDVGYQFKNTLEVIFRYSVTDYENCCDSNTVHCNVFDLWNFNIGDNEVVVGHPSDTFRLIFRNYEDDDYFVGWEAFNTIRINGKDSTQLQNVLQQSLFWIYQMCPSVYDISFPEIGCLCYEDSEADIGVDEIPYAKTIFNDEYNNEEYKLSNYAEPIYFYNAAKRINDIDIAFLYFYKILEFFFIISQRNRIKQDVDNFISNNNIEHFVDSLHTDYFGKKEDLLLDQLIDVIDSKVIEDVRNLAFTSKLILQNDNKEFSNQLYLHRNSIVHGKFEFKNLQLKLPNKVDDRKSSVWTEIIEKISFHLIRVYCYDK